MRALVALSFFLAVPSAAQGLLLPEGARGGGLSVGTTFNDGLSDGVVEAVATFHPAFDLVASVGRAPISKDGLSALGLGGRLHIDRDGDSRAAAVAGLGRVAGDGFGPVYVVSVGAQAGRQVRAGALLLVPNLTVGVSTVVGGRVAGGLQTSATVSLPVLFGAEGDRAYLAPSVTLNSEAVRFRRAADSFLVGLSAGVVFGGASGGR